jgi:uncharacterized protein with ParB-like and HNH nuclease domain
LEIKPQGLGACVGGNFLSVPKYQRAFSWDDENVSNFLADVNTAFANGSPEYFMGSVVLQGLHVVSCGTQQSHWAGAGLNG